MLTTCRIKRGELPETPPCRGSCQSMVWNAVTQRFKARFKTCLQTRGETVSGAEKSPKTADQEPTGAWSHLRRASTAVGAKAVDVGEVG